jgi:hypothetical protein
MTTQAHRRAVTNWYTNREALHIERANLQAPILAECSHMMTTLARTTVGTPRERLDKIQSLQNLVGTALYTGYDTFDAQANDLSELGPEALTAWVHKSVPSLWLLITWLRAADARLGTYPQER